MNIELIMYIWEDGYFQIDAQDDLIGLASTPIIEGYKTWK